MSPDQPAPDVYGDDDVVFRTLAAPGLDEDDLFAAMGGLRGPGVLWGDGLPSTFPPAEAEWDAETERHRRHEALLRAWGHRATGGP